ncbi:hypothetical protein ACUXCC_005539 [Cytobacillus horneckiae]|nr:hypothetical protein [Cytobacillus horneckiae]
MKAIIIKGPLFEQRRKEAQELLYNIIKNQVLEQINNASRKKHSK